LPLQYVSVGNYQIFCDVRHIPNARSQYIFWLYCSDGQYRYYPECGTAMGHDFHKKTPFYRPRNPSASPFFRIVQQYFDDSKHRTCAEHSEAARRAATWTVAVNLRESIRRSTRKSTGSGERSFVHPSISFLNAAISKRDLHGSNAKIVVKSFLWHFHAGNAAAAPHAIRNARYCLRTVSRMKFLPTCRIGSGFSQFQSGFGFTSGSIEVCWASSVSRPGKQYATFTHWKLTAISASPP
jgi:hypothetical protein